MSIYKPTRLYIKSITRVDGSVIKYFGKSTSQDIYSYTGSGKLWLDFIKKYGKDSIVTEWVSDWFTDPQEISNYAIQFSIDNDIVNSELWANLKLENGLDGGMLSESSKQILSKKQSGKYTGGTTNRIWINDGIRQACIPNLDSIPDGWVRGRLRGRCGKLFSKKYQPRFLLDTSGLE